MARQVEPHPKKKANVGLAISTIIVLIIAGLTLLSKCSSTPEEEAAQKRREQRLQEMADMPTNSN